MRADLSGFAAASSCTPLGAALPVNFCAIFDGLSPETTLYVFASGAVDGGAPVGATGGVVTIGGAGGSGDEGGGGRWVGGGVRMVGIGPGRAPAPVSAPVALGLAPGLRASVGEPLR